MSYSDHTAAVSFGDIKTAALYFDRVLPVGFRAIRGGPGVNFELPEPVPASVVGQLVFGDAMPALRSPGGMALDYLLEHWQSFFTEAQNIMGARFPSTNPEGHELLKEAYLANLGSQDASRSIRHAFRKLANRLGISSYSILLGDSSDTHTLEPSYASLALNNVRLVDLTETNWKQILEFRTDQDSRKKLRRLRLLFFAEFVGKPRSFIQDDIQRRLDDYEIAAKKHGFELVNGSLSALLDANSLQAAAVASVAAAIFGGPLAGLAAGAVVEIGRLAITVSERLLPIIELADTHELGYIITARKNLTSSS
jgi:hypothetical protein